MQTQMPLDARATSALYEYIDFCTLYPNAADYVKRSKWDAVWSKYGLVPSVAITPAPTEAADQDEYVPGHERASVTGLPWNAAIVRRTRNGYFDVTYGDWWLAHDGRTWRIGGVPDIGTFATEDDAKLVLQKAVPPPTRYSAVVYKPANDSYDVMTADAYLTCNGEWSTRDKHNDHMGVFTSFGHAMKVLRNAVSSPYIADDRSKEQLASWKEYAQGVQTQLGQEREQSRKAKEELERQVAEANKRANEMESKAAAWALKVGRARGALAA